jgi:U3 small nucleolar RNA-associated protein 21
MLHKMTPSAIDFEIRALSLENDYHELKVIMKFLLTQLKANSFFEIAQAVMAVFLKAHAEVLAQDEALVTMVNELKEQQQACWSRLQTLFHQNLCLITYFSNIQT